MGTDNPIMRGELYDWFSRTHCFTGGLPFYFVAYSDDTHPDEQICGLLQNNLAPGRIGYPRNRADSLFRHREKTENKGWGRCVAGEQFLLEGCVMHTVKFYLRIMAAAFAVLVISSSAMAIEKPEIFVQMGHSDRAETMVFSEDGRYLVTGSEDKTVKLWDAGSGSEIRTFTWHFDNTGYNDIESVGISNDGRYVLAGDMEGIVKIWDSISGKEIRSYKKHSTSVKFVRFSADEKRVISIGSKLKVWDTFTGQDTKSIDDIVGISMSPANNYVLSGSEYGPAKNTYTVYDIATLRKIYSFKAKFESSPSSVAFSQNGRYYLMSNSDYIKDTIKEKFMIELWDMETGRKVYAIEMDKRVWNVAMSPDGKYGLAAGDKLLLFDIHTGKPLKIITDKSTYFSLFSADGKRIIYSEFFSTSPTLYDISTSKIIRKFVSRAGVPIHGTDISADGKLAFSGGNDNILRLWDIHAGRLVKTMKGDSQDETLNCINTVAISPNGKYGATGGYHVFKLWDLSTGKNIKTWDLNNIEGLEPPDYLEPTVVTSISFSPDNRYVALSQGVGYIIVIEVESGNIKVKLKGSPTDCPLSFSPDGEYLIHSIANSSPSSEALGPGKTIVWDIENDREVKRFEGVGCGVFSPDSKYVLYGEKDGLKLWDIQTGRKIKDFKTNALIGSFGMGWWKDTFGKFFVPGNDRREVTIYESDSPSKIITFKEHLKYITDIKFMPDGKSVFSSSFDGTIRLWDINTGKEIAQFINFTDGEWIVITPEGYYNSSANGDKHLNVGIGNRVYGIDQYRAAFYKPRIVQAVLRGVDIEDAVARISGEHKEALSAAYTEPPFVVIKSPEDGKKINSTNTEISLYIEDRNQTIKKVTVFVNGRVASGAAGRGIKVTSVIPEGKKSLDLKFPVHLDVGENLIEVTAFNGFSEGRKSIRLYSSATGVKGKVILPNLWILSIGINSYQDKNLNSLSYAAADSEGIVEVFSGQKGKLFREVNSLVINDRSHIKPTYENIMDNLNYLSKAGHNDVALLFIAGHGMNDDRGNFYFLPSDAVIMENGTIKRSRAISWREIKSILDIPAKKLIFADTCHSEGVSGKKTRGVDNDRFVKELQGANAVIFTSSRGRELSQESDKWKHGAFTYALIEGIKGKADLIKDGKISMKELDAYVSETVPKITNGAQHPITNTPDGYVNFPVALIK